MTSTRPLFHLDHKDLLATNAGPAFRKLIQWAGTLNLDSYNGPVSPSNEDMREFQIGVRDSLLTYPTTYNNLGVWHPRTEKKDLVPFTGDCFILRAAEGASIGDRAVKAGDMIHIASDHLAHDFWTLTYLEIIMLVFRTKLRVGETVPLKKHSFLN